VRKWVAAQIRSQGTKPVVVIDPDAIVTTAELEAEFGAAAVYTVHSWFELRRAWELHGRHPNGVGARVVLLVWDPTVGSPTDLPFDIEHTSEVRRVRTPGPPDVRPVLAGVDHETSDIAVERMMAGTLGPIDAILTAAARLPSVKLAGVPVREFQAALRLTAEAQPKDVIALAARRFDDPLARAVLAEPPRLDELQRVWEEWLADPAGVRWAEYVTECRAELIDLFMAGRLRPSPKVDRDIPLWATVGVAQESPASRAAALLDSPPTEAASLDDWVRVAQWWGEVRSCLAQVNPADDDLEARAWGWWVEADQRFLAWLRASYGSQLTRTWARWPASLDKVQPFLAKRQAEAGNLLLVVLDGMGFTQWTRIRELASVRVAQSGGVLAMLPTLTEVSRQAIAAGSPPNQFAESLRSTSREAQRWAAAWSEAGVSTAWVRVDGARIDELSVVPLGSADVIGVVLSATDELMHSAELLGDIGLHAGIEAWVRSGVFGTLIQRAAAHGYETWLTADHGNLAVAPMSEPREGAFVERAGTRTRRYASKTLRDNAAVEGVVWDALPGYPSDESERLLFAPGRTGWGPSRLSHGGLSLDEVIVPLVQIEAAS
jgi:hypothetical protein